jgi:peptidyl-prolyl cis-trans isomerase B (cyclophilin B)
MARPDVYPAAAMRRLLVVSLSLLVLLLAACGDNESTAGSEDGGEGQTAETTATEPTGTGCRDAEEPAARKVEERKRPTFRVAKDKTYTAVLQTSCGAIEIALDTKRAPRTTSSIVSLVREGFYDGLSFHRVIAGFVVQGGDPQGTGNGGPGYSVTEAPPADLKYEPGIVAMAKTQLEEPGTSGSQFFIVSGPDGGNLTPDYALVGKVSKGMDVVERLQNVPVDPAADNRPIEPVVIEKATIRES